MIYIPTCGGGRKLGVQRRATTGKPSFAVRENLCRAFSIGRTAKNFFAVRFI
jgi:hypothetical protein